MTPMLDEDDTTAKLPRRRRVDLAAASFKLAIGVSVTFTMVFIARGVVVIGGSPYGTLFDDAMVSMRFARNLARGEGLVWNPGEPGVEGYTNFGWTLVMAFLHWVGLPENLLGIAIAAISGLALVATLFVVRALARELVDQDSAAPVVAVWLTALGYPLAYWALRGMEVGVLALVLTSAALATVRMVKGRDDLLPTVAVLAIVGILVRTDALLPLGALACCAVAMSPPRRRLVVAVVLGGAMLATLGMHSVARELWYGDALPNTYYLKVQGFPLGDRLARGAVSLVARLLSGLWLPAALAALHFALRPSRLRTPAVIPAAMALAMAAYSVWVGGDAWEWMPHANRYLATTIPLLAVAASLGIDDVVRRARVHQLRWLVGLSVAGAFALGIVYSHVIPLERLQVTDNALTLHGQAIAITVLTLVCGAIVARHRPEVAGMIVAAAVIMAIGLVGFSSWWSNGGEHVEADKAMTRVAVELDRELPDDTTIGVVWAGSLGYFSDRTTVDLLGKSDRTIAHGPPQDGWPFWPGHSKWQHEHSLGQLHPDIVLGVWGPDPEAPAAFGYEPLAGPNDTQVWIDPTALTDEERARLADLIASAGGPLVEPPQFG